MNFPCFGALLVSKEGNKEEGKEGPDLPIFFNLGTSVNLCYTALTAIKPLSAAF